ncbi:hypothetical protein [Altericista sp. CCNU0014]|uniref:hypothetical protein n=1 Tax=Altericista sp. CCNU0014 TaxID=3082949 RepID=UPI003850D722
MKNISEPEKSTQKPDRVDSDLLTQNGKIDVNKAHLTANPGDRISDEPQTVEEKKNQLAVDSGDITGEHLKVPTYFVFKIPGKPDKVLHHVKDAQEISDMIRLARVDENGNRVWW